MKATRLWVISYWLLGMSVSAFSAESQGAVDGVRATLEKWVESRKVISLEQRDWALGKEMLDERIELLQQEIGLLQLKTAEAQESLNDADRKRADRVEENETLKETSVLLAETVLTLEKKTKGLTRRLPDPIRTRIKPLSQRMPDDAGETKLSLAERFQNVVGILNEVNKFNREITLTSEVRSLPDGTSAEVTALYVGIGQAYYAGANGQIAGVGRPSPEGWTWTSNNDDAAQIIDAIAILKNEQVAMFVQLPVEIK